LLKDLKVKKDLPKLEMDEEEIEELGL